VCIARSFHTPLHADFDIWHYRNTAASIHCVGEPFVCLIDGPLFGNRNFQCDFDALSLDACLDAASIDALAFRATLGVLRAVEEVAVWIGMTVCDFSPAVFEFSRRLVSGFTSLRLHLLDGNNTAV
jgi:hypothetical protein